MPKPHMLELLPEEQALLDRIVFAPPHDASFHDHLDESCEASGDLTARLIERDAIPEVRVRWLTDPEFNVGRTKLSRQQVFERNGSKGRDMVTHPHFLPYLKYFVYGPDLPGKVIFTFGAAVDSHPFISGSTYPELVDIAKQAVRHYGLSPHEACEEFFKLTNECGVDSMYGRLIRDQVQRVRSR